MYKYQDVYAVTTIQGLLHRLIILLCYTSNKIIRVSYSSRMIFLIYSDFRKNPIDAPDRPEKQNE